MKIANRQIAINNKIQVDSRNNRLNQMSPNPLKSLIETVKTGSREEVKEAQKQIEKISRGAGRDKAKKKMFRIFREEMEDFAEIKSVDNQAYFINTLKHPFLILGEEYFPVFAEFILQQIQNPSGKIRMAVIRAADWLLIMAIDFCLPRYEKPAPAQMERDKLNKERFCLFAYALEKLLDLYREPKYERYKYIDSLPAGVYKSLEMLLGDCVLRSESRREVFQEFMIENSRQPFCNPGLKEFIKFVYQTRPEKVLSPIKLKYRFDNKQPHERAAYVDEICLRCEKKGIVMGASIQTGTGEIRAICEDCAIDQYQYDKGYRTREAAKASRRRIFDVGYLLEEMLAEKYLRDNQIDDVNKLRPEELQRLFMAIQQRYNDEFTREEKIKLEETEKQKDIERVLRRRMEKMAINPGEVKSFAAGMPEGLA